MIHFCRVIIWYCFIHGLKRSIQSCFPSLAWDNLELSWNVRISFTRLQRKKMIFVRVAPVNPSLYFYKWDDYRGCSIWEQKQQHPFSHRRQTVWLTTNDRCSKPKQKPWLQGPKNSPIIWKTAQVGLRYLSLIQSAKYYCSSGFDGSWKLFH